jgi:AraC-like DNA-binding protein
MLHTHVPGAPLPDFINEFWLWEGYQPPHPQERILPIGTMEIIFNLSDHPMSLSYPSDGFQPRRFARAFVAGARSEYFLVDTRQPTTVMGVYFKPGAALPFFGTSGRDLHNLHISLDEFWRHAADDVYDQLRAARTPVQRFHILEAALCARLARYTGRHRAVDFALTAFHNEYSITQVVDQIALSPTRFIQVFSEEIGLTPKLYCRVQRFQNALRHIVERKTESWAELALLCGYFDQSHLINEFQTFAGISPTLYVPQHPEHRSNLAVLE